MTENGGSGTDNLYGGYGETIMDGGAGADTLHGQSGSVDVFKFDPTDVGSVDTVSQFSTGDGDKLNFADILEGNFHPGTDDITHFIEITTNGSNSEVFVDPTGTSTFGSAEHIATIVGVTGLTDEAADVTAGLLVAA